MAEPAPLERVVEMKDYLRDTIQDIDAWMRDQQAKRNGFAIRLAALEASDDPDVLAAAAAYEAAEGNPYPDAEPAEGLIVEAHRHYVP